MWNKRDENEVPRRQSQPAAVPGPGNPTPVLSAAGEVSPPSRGAVIGASMRIQGEIRTAEEMRIDGEVEGKLESESVLTVGPNGNVRANIKARELVVYGSLNGNVMVEGKITIRQQGSLIGDIRAAGITIDDGAYFKGSIEILREGDHPTSAALLRAEPAEEKSRPRALSLSSQSLEAGE